MKTIDIEKLNQLVSRTDISGNDKVKWLIDFIDGKELHQQEQMYSEEEVKVMFDRYNEFIAHHDIEEWQPWIDKQFKKK